MIFISDHLIAVLMERPTIRLRLLSLEPCFYLATEVLLPLLVILCVRMSTNTSMLGACLTQMDYTGSAWSELSWAGLRVCVCPELRTTLCEPGTQGGCSQVEEHNLSQQASKQLCKCMNRDNISIMRPVLYHQSLQKGLKPDLPPSSDSPSVIAPYY